MSEDKQKPEAAAPTLPSEAAGELRPPYKAAAIAGGLVFMLYAITLSRTTAFWDTSEYIATGHIMGVPHQPGNPLFVLLARAWSVLLAPLGLSVAVRINLFSAAMSAGAHALWFLVVHHILRYFSDDRRFRMIGAAAAVLVSATAFTVWNQSNVNEKVYTVSLLTIALLTWLAVRWQENLGKGKDDHLLILMAFILGLSVGNHLMAFLVAPAIGLFVLWVHPKALLNWKLYVGGMVAVILGLSVHLILPIRAGLGPVINEADPSCPNIGSAIEAIVTYGNAGCVALAEALQRNQYLKPPLLPRQAPLPDQFINYLQYFDWQWARSMDGMNTVFGGLRLPFTMLFTGLGVWGAIEHAKRDKASFVFMLTLFATVSAALIFYLNFKYGYTLRAPTQDRALHEVRERDYFFLVSFSVWGLWAGMGIATLWREAAGELKTTMAKASPILALAFIPLVFNWGWASRAKDYAARDWAYNLLMSVEPYAVLFTNGDNDTFPLWYLQEVEGIRADVTVIVGQYLFTKWYPRQLEQLTRPENQRVFDASLVPGLYEHPGVPSGSITSMTGDEMDAIGTARIAQALTIPFPALAVTYPAETVLNRGQQLALRIIFDSIGERPIYFASMGGMLGELGLDPWGVRSGLATKLVPRSLEREAPTGLVQGSDPYGALWFDLNRSLRLYDEVYQYRGIRDRPIWQDRSTVNIPLQYYAMALQLADAVEQAGGPVDVSERLRVDSAMFRRVADGGMRLGG
jgi:hypothetical protein